MNYTAVIATTIFAAGAAAAQEHRELEAHQHGHGTLNIAIEGSSIQIELEAPGFDIVGFEHDAETEETRAAVASAIAQLERPDELIALPDAAGCDVISVAAEMVGDEHHDEVHHGKAGDEETADTDEEHDEAAHSEFHAEFRFTCSDMKAATSIDFPYFEVFPNAEELDIQVVSDTGAGAFEASRENRTIDLSPLM